MNIQLESDINKLIDCDALELAFAKGDDSTVYIPYMMNDAVECFYKFSNCKIMGQWDDKLSCKECTIAQNGEKTGLIINQSDTNVVTIWFESYEKRTELYQYHRIAHNWVKGDEKWRRLVYIIGTLHDKLSFMGPEYCEPEELELIPLMGFAPFRFFTPIHESLNDYYADTKDGLAAMFKVAQKANDDAFGTRLMDYSKDWVNGTMSSWKFRRIVKSLSKSQEVYNYINSQIEKASIKYSPRQYTNEQEAAHEKIREQKSRELEEKGYKGQYPNFSKGRKKITLFEEHPYILHEFEYDGFEFDVNPVEE